MDAKSKVIKRWWISGQHQARHSWLQNDSLVGVQFQHHTFAKSIDTDNPLARNASIEVIDSRRDLNRLSRASRPFDGDDVSPLHTGDPAPHRFNLGKFWHERKG
jgi:hypothetical protein